MLNDLKVLLTDYKNEYLIKCFGAYYEEGCVKIILELMDCGSLRDIINMMKCVFPQNSYISEEILATITF